MPSCAVAAYGSGMRVVLPSVVVVVVVGALAACAPSVDRPTGGPAEGEEVAAGEGEGEGDGCGAGSCSQEGEGEAVGEGEGDVLRISRDVDLANCSVTTFAVDRRNPQGMTLEQFNEVFPLEEAAAPVTREPDVPLAPR